VPTFAFRPTGVVLDVPPEAAPPDAWTSVTDGTFEAGITTRPAGEVREYYPNASLIAVPQFVMHAGEDASAIGALDPQHCWWYVGNTVSSPAVRVHEVRDTGFASNRTPTGWTVAIGAAPNQATGGILNGIPFVNVISLPNSLAYGLPGAASALNTLVPAANDIFRAVRAYRYQLVGMGVYNPGGTDYSTRVNWTASAAPGAFPSTWAASAGNDAGSFDVPYCRGPLVDGGQLGEDFMLYAEGSTHVMTYTGGAEIMQLRGVARESGALSRNCWADVGIGHVVLTTSDVVLATPAGVQSIADGAVRRALFGPNGALSLANARYAHVVYHRARREVWVCYPTAGAYCENALVWHVPTGKWGHRSLTNRQRSAATGRTNLTDLEARTRELTVCASQGAAAALTDGRLYLADQPSGSTYETRSPVLSRQDMDLGEPGRVKLVRAIRPRFQEQGSTVTGLEVRAGGRNSATEAITWSGWAAYAPTTDDTVHLFATGRLISVELRHNAGTKPWRLTGLDIDFDLRGRW
jgi:hypothetical protein